MTDFNPPHNGHGHSHPSAHAHPRLHSRDGLPNVQTEVDRLYTVRAHIRELQAEAADLRRRILAGEASDIGDEYIAVLRRQLLLARRS